MYSILSSQQVEAVTHFLGKCVVPIFDGSRATPRVEGTGFFVDLYRQPYLVSAGHVIQRSQPELLSVPTKPEGPQVQTLGQGTAITNNDTERLDVGVYRLENAQVISQLRKSWTFLSRDFLPRDELLNSFLVAGYPESQTKVDGHKISSRPIQQIYTTVYDGPTDETPDPYDLFLKYSDQATATGERLIKTPKLHGVSGAPVWGIRTLDPSSVWAPEKALALVGVEFAFAHKKYIRCKSWQVVQALISRTRRFKRRRTRKRST